MKKKINKEKTNPYHKEYGVISNSIHAFKAMTDYSKKFIPLIMIGFICAPIMQYLWSFISKFVIDMINDNRQVSALILLMTGFAVIQILSTMLNSFYKSKYYLYIGARFRQIKLKNRKIMSVNYECLEDKDIMDCYQKANNACNSNNVGVEGMMRSIVNLIMIIPIIVTGIVILGTMNIFIVIAMIICAVIQFFISNRTNKKAKEKVWDPLAPWWRKHNYLVYTTSDFSAAKDIRMFGLREWLTDKFKALNKERYEAQKMNSKIWLFASIANTVIWTVIQAAVYGWLILSVVNGNMSIGNFTLYLASSMTFFEYINNLLNAVSDLFAKSREYDDFRSFMDIDGGENNSGGKEVPVCSRYEFTFRNVSFKYPKAENYALKNVNLTLKAGERLAVVGLNGAGKSTFIKLLMRLYEPTEGEILLNGVNIKEYNKNSYYSIFSPAFQEVNLFAFPLFMNVSMLPEDNTDKQRAEQCVIASGLEEKLKELDKGIDTEMLKVIYDDGTDLSGGEKQKLALARALYKNAPVVVLDEPTAALDALAESKLYGDFDKFIGSKTAVYISHRLSSTQFCDKVAMFKDGSIIEYGTHSELMKMGGEYSNMFSVQAQYYIDSREEVTADA
ncbi:MAG: ABC transporter ATP-binding protein [Ruminiclostridium sp.]